MSIVLVSTKFGLFLQKHDSKSVLNLCGSTFRWIRLSNGLEHGALSEVMICTLLGFQLNQYIQRWVAPRSSTLIVYSVLSEGFV